MLFRVNLLIHKDSAASSITKPRSSTSDSTAAKIQSSTDTVIEIKRQIWLLTVSLAELKELQKHLLFFVKQNLVQSVFNDAFNSISQAQLVSRFSTNEIEQCNSWLDSKLLAGGQYYTQVS